MTRSGAARRALLWAVASCALLSVGFGAVVAGLYGLGLATGSFDAAATAQNRVIVSTYFRIVLVKGLLPQLLLALALWPAVRRLLPGAEQSTRRLAFGLALAGALAYAVVAPLLLTAELPGWPALQLRRPDHQLGTGLLSVTAVVVAALVGRRVVYGRRPTAARSDPELEARADVSR